MNRLKRYGFKDEYGHPLENCTEWIAVIRELTALRAFRERFVCEICHGTGGGNNDPCSNCGGEGYLQ